MAEAGHDATGHSRRPLSPHLQIYKPIINMVMSIFHRLTGVALYAGAIGLAWWLFAAAHGPDYFDYVSSLFVTIPGKIVLFGFTWALLHHMIGGLRHFVWDLGYGFDLKTVDILSWGTLILSVALTALIWGWVILGSGDPAVQLVHRSV